MTQRQPGNGGGRVGMGAAMVAAALVVIVAGAVLFNRPPSPPSASGPVPAPGSQLPLPVPNPNATTPRFPKPAAVAPYRPATPLPTAGQAGDLVRAAGEGRAAEVKRLLLAHADRASRDAALAAAVSHCQAECVQLLLAGGAAMTFATTPGTDGRSALNVAEEGGKIPGTPCADVVRVLELAGVRNPARPKR